MARDPRRGQKQEKRYCENTTKPKSFVMCSSSNKNLFLASGQLSFNLIMLYLSVCLSVRPLIMSFMLVTSYGYNCPSCHLINFTTKCVTKTQTFQLTTTFLSIVLIICLWISFVLITFKQGQFYQNNCELFYSLTRIKQQREK